MVTFFWCGFLISSRKSHLCRQVLDVKAMIKKTDDAPGDLCAHARSVVIQEVSQITMEVFMKDFNRILSEAILSDDDDFYEERG